MPRYATPDAVHEAALQWSPAVLECRDLGHSWAAYDAKYVSRLHYYAVSHICTRCSTQRHREISESGTVYASWYTYSEGYLVQDLGRIVGQAKGILRITAIQRTFEVTRVTGRAKDADLPRSSKTPGGPARRLRAVGD